ncbi:hypothetical protein [Devriesea agamarum]|uniref:hypothetical protein n=1 Tax=Devriesea agamarum TaxID=472569 RepID=UPI0012EEC0C1|nr:hypothetical protein [Devriesea agamarum]
MSEILTSAIAPASATPPTNQPGSHLSPPALFSPVMRLAPAVMLLALASLLVTPAGMLAAHPTDHSAYPFLLCPDDWILL